MKLAKSEKHKVEARLDMTPLIDVVFQQLIFFMLTSAFVVQSSIHIELPEAEGARELETKDISITLTHPGFDERGALRPEGFDGQGRIFVNDVEVHGWDALTNVLDSLHRQQPESVVLIRPDAQVSTARLVRVLGIANGVGVTRYGIAARPLEDEGGG